MSKRLVIASVLMAGALTGILSMTMPLVYADDISETEIEPKNKQTAVGSGINTNVENCAENDIKGGLIDVQQCGTANVGDGDGGDGDGGDGDGGDGDGGDGDGGDGGTIQITICHRPPGNPEDEQTLTVGISALPAHLLHGDSLGPC